MRSIYGNVWGPGLKTGFLSRSTERSPSLHQQSISLQYVQWSCTEWNLEMSLDRRKRQIIHKHILTFQTFLFYLKSSERGLAAWPAVFAQLHECSFRKAEAKMISSSLNGKSVSIWISYFKIKCHIFQIVHWEKVCYFLIIWHYIDNESNN